MTNTAIIYARVSDHEQAEDELSVPSQIEACEGKAKTLDAVVLRTFKDEGKSGTNTKHRRQFLAALSYCAAHQVSYFLVWDSSRFARNIKDHVQSIEALAATGTKVLYVAGGADPHSEEGWFIDCIEALINQKYSRNVARDTKRSLMRNAREGFFNGGRVPFGYCSFEVGKRRKLKVHDAEASVVREIYRMCFSGSGAKEIATALNVSGISRRGAAWSANNVRLILDSAVYAGYTTFNRENRRLGVTNDEADWIKTASHPGIVTDDEFARVGALIKSRAPVTSKSSPKSNHTFTGAMRCFRCDSNMIIQTSNGRSKLYSYYECGKKYREGTCEGYRFAADEADAHLSGVILDRILTRERVADIVRELQAAALHWIETRANERRLLVVELRDAELRRKNLFGVLEQYGVDAPNLSDIAPRLRELKQKIETIETAITELEARPDVEAFTFDADEVTETVRNLATASANGRAAREFFAGFIERITPSPDGVNIEYRADRIALLGDPVRSNDVWLPVLVLLRTEKLAMNGYAETMRIFRAA